MLRRPLIILGSVLLLIAIGFAVFAWLRQGETPSQDTALTGETSGTVPVVDENPPAIQIPTSERISLNTPRGELSVKNFLKEDQRFGTTFFVAENENYWITYQRETNNFIIGILGSSRLEVMSNAGIAEAGFAELLDVPAADLCKLDRLVVRDSEYGRGFEYSTLDFPSCGSAISS